MTVTLNILLSGVPKRVILDMAFEDCGLAGFDFERTAEEVTSALRKLNAMMKEWPWNVLPYNQPTYGVGQPEDLSNIPGDAEATIAMNLALRIAPGMGLTLAPEQRASLARSQATFVAQYSSIPDMALARHTPRGAGNRRWYAFVHDEPTTYGGPCFCPPAIPGVTPLPSPTPSPTPTPTPTPGFTPSLRFNDARNSMYLGAML